MEGQPKNPEFRNNPENFHPCRCRKMGHFGKVLKIGSPTQLKHKMSILQLLIFLMLIIILCAL